MVQETPRRTEPSKPSEPTRPFFLMEDLIAALNSRGAEVLSPHEQMQREEACEQEDVARAVAASLHTATSRSPAGPAGEGSSTSIPGPSPSTHGDWTMIHAHGAPIAVVTGQAIHTASSPIPDAFVDEIIAALDVLRVGRLNGPFTTDLAAAIDDSDAQDKGKKKEVVNVQVPPAPSVDTTTHVTGPPRDITGFVCAKCNAHNLVRSASETWYTVTVGKDVGVFNGWPTVQPLVSGVSNACYKKYKSEREARDAYNLAFAAGTVAIVP